MSTAELKIKLIEEITKSEDEALLREALHLLNLNASDGALYQLSEGEENMLNEAEADIEAGNIITEAEANQRIQKWLGK
ncbi:MAG: hypothetical protein JST83_03030 [Bacteroidetes bacterium]|nr:hypothetical protein [Bacteroidota bacterium]